MLRSADFPLKTFDHNIGGLIFDVCPNDGIVGGEIYCGRGSRDLSGEELKFWISMIGIDQILEESLAKLFRDPCALAKAQRESAFLRAIEEEAG